MFVDVSLVFKTRYAKFEVITKIDESENTKEQTKFENVSRHKNTTITQRLLDYCRFRLKELSVLSSAEGTFLKVISNIKAVVASYFTLKPCKLVQTL